jgi:hypothetical protein
MPAVDGLPTDTTGYNGMPAAYLNPQTEDDVISLFAPVPEGDSLPESGGVPAMQSGGGTSFGMRDSTTSFGAGAYQPSEETLQQFAEYSDQYDAAKPKQKKAIESQRTIVYDNKDALGRDIQNLDDDQFGFAQLEAGAADPTFVGIQFSRYKLGNVNAKGEQMYNPNTDADASIGRLQEAFNLVNDRPELKDIYTKYPDISRGSATNLLLNKETDIENIKNPRFDTKWVLPTSFDDFVYNGSPSGQTAIILSYLMGYKKIILLGMDGNFKFKNNNYLDVKESHWFENYFNGNEYNMMDFCSKCTEESINNMQYNSFYNVSKAFTANRINIDIVNCTPNSPYNMFRTSTLEEELNGLQV